MQESKIHAGKMIIIKTEMAEMPKSCMWSEGEGYKRCQYCSTKLCAVENRFNGYLKVNDPRPDWCPLQETNTVKEFAQNAISRVFEGITQRFCDCYNDGLRRGYPDSELSMNFLRAFDECKDIAEKEINDLAEQYGKEKEV